MAIVGTKNGIFAIGNIIKNIYEEKDNILSLEPDIASNGKVTSLLSKFIITPNVIIDKKLEYMDKTVLRDMIKTEVVLFTAIVSNAIRIMVELHGVDPRMAINKVSKTSNLEDAEELNDIFQGLENFDYINDLLNNDGFLPATEDKKRDFNGITSLSNNNYIQKDVSGFVNTYELQVAFETKKGNKSVFTMPLVIYPNIVYSDSENLINNMLDSDSDKSFFNRVDEYRAGLVSLSDLIFATDIVKKYKDRKISNESNFAKYLNKIDKVHGIKDLIHNKNSFSRNFNIYLLDKSNMHTMNKLIKGNMLRDTDKDKLTDSLMAFSVTFVDIENEELTLLLDSIPSFSVLNFNMLKKEKESDVTSLLKDMLNNKQPF